MTEKKNDAGEGPRGDQRPPAKQETQTGSEGTRSGPTTPELGSQPSGTGTSGEGSNASTTEGQPRDGADNQPAPNGEPGARIEARQTVELGARATETKTSESSETKTLTDKATTDDKAPEKSEPKQSGDEKK